MNPELHSMNYDELNQHNSMTPKVATDQSPTTLYNKHKKKKKSIQQYLQTMILSTLKVGK